MDECKCGHPGSMHSDGEFTCVGECFTELDVREGKPIKELEFCNCEKFVRETGEESK